MVDVELLYEVGSVGLKTAVAGTVAFAFRLKPAVTLTVAFGAKGAEDICIGAGLPGRIAPAALTG